MNHEKSKNICKVDNITKLMIVTMEPKEDKFKIVIKVPYSYLWSLNYKIYFNKEDIDVVLRVIK